MIASKYLQIGPNSRILSNEQILVVPKVAQTLINENTLLNDKTINK